MLSDESYTEFALFEYRRSSKFKTFVDAEVAALREKGAIPLGEPLSAIFGRPARDGLPLAKVLLSAFEAQTDQPQWQRASAAL